MKEKGREKKEKGKVRVSGRSKEEGEGGAEAKSECVRGREYVRTYLIEL